MDYRPIHISRPALLKPAISPRFIIIMSSADMTLNVAEALLTLCRARLLYHCDKREAHLNEIIIMDNVPNSSYSYSWTRSFGRPRPILDGNKFISTYPNFFSPCSILKTDNFA